MSEIEVGDKVQWKPAAAWTDIQYKVLAIHEEFLWLLDQADGSTRTMRAEFMEKVEPTFEVGKTYVAKSDPTVELKVKAVDDKYAYALGKSGFPTWAHTNQRDKFNEVGSGGAVSG